MKANKTMLGTLCLCLAALGLIGCQRYEVKEDFSRFPYKITKTPYRAENIYANKITWANNETVLFITWLKEKGKWRKVLGEWKTDGRFRELANQPRSVCSRSGYVLYSTGKLSGIGTVFYGSYGENIEQYPKGTIIDIDDCILHRRRSDFIEKHDQYFTQLIKPNTFISSNTYPMSAPPPPAYYIDTQGFETLMPFSAEDAKYYQYYEHTGRYYINRVSTWACQDQKCKDTGQWHIWTFDEDGQVETINITKTYPWFGYPLAFRNQGHMYRLYPTKQGDLLSIGGDPSRRIKKGGGVYLMKAGSDPVQLIDGSIDPPAFSPNGCKIAIARDTYPLARDWKNRNDRLVIIDLCKPSTPS